LLQCCDLVSNIEDLINLVDFGVVELIIHVILIWIPIVLVVIILSVGLFDLDDILIFFLENGLRFAISVFRSLIILIFFFGKFFLLDFKTSVAQCENCFQELTEH
jgi:hypothetical protein